MTGTAVLDRVPGAGARTLGERTLEELHEKHRRVLFSFLTKLTGDRHRAEDLVQEVMVRAWRHPDALERPDAPALPWLLTVARRLTIDAHRARQARPAEIQDAEPEAAPQRVDEIERNATALDVRNAVAELGPAHRAVLIELYFHGLSIAETAEKLGIPEGTVKSRAYYALRAMRGSLEAYGRGE